MHFHEHFQLEILSKCDIKAGISSILCKFHDGRKGPRSMGSNADRFSHLPYFIFIHLSALYLFLRRGNSVEFNEYDFMMTSHNVILTIKLYLGVVGWCSGSAKTGLKTVFAQFLYGVLPGFLGQCISVTYSRRTRVKRLDKNRMRMRALLF